MISADYLIIGTGPVGVFTAKYLLEKNKKIVIVDNSDKKSSKKDIKLNLKDSDKKGFVYDFDNAAVYKKQDILISSSNRWLYKVWGGTLTWLLKEKSKN